MFIMFIVTFTRYNVGGRYHRTGVSNSSDKNYSQSISDVNRRWFGLDQEKGIDEGSQLKVGIISG